MKKKSTDTFCSLSISSRSEFTKIRNGRRFVYFPTTPHYVENLCVLREDYYEVKELKTIELRHKKERFVFNVEDIIFKIRDGINVFKIYLGDVLEYEDRRKEDTRTIGSNG